MALTKLRIRRSTSSEWAAFNPTLQLGEPGLDTTLGILKIGDGTTPWAFLDIWATAVPADQVGGVLTSVDWANIINRPATFPPDPHNHLTTDITNFIEAVQDAMGASIVAGTNVTVSYDDAAGTITIGSTGGAGGLDAEAVRDTIGTALQSSGPISITVNDPGDTITITSAATINSTDAALRDRSTHTGTQLSSTISDFTEAAQDVVGALLVAGANVTVTYNDASNTLTVAAVMDAEFIRDTIGTALVAGNGVAVAVDDAGDTITVSRGPQTISSKTGTTYTFTLADAGTVVEGSNAAAQTFTVPPNSTAGFSIGSDIEIVQMGAGQITIAAGAGVTIRSRGAALKSAGQYAVLSLRKRATDEWVLTGDATT